MAGPVISITVEALTGAAKGAIDSFFSGVQSASQKIRGVNEQWKEFGDSVQAAAAALAAYFGASQMSGFVREATEAREAMARLANEIRKSGQPIAEFTGELEAQRKAFQALTGTDDDVIVSIQTMLLTMGVQRGDMRQTTLDVLNLSAALGVDAVTAAQQLGNALAGNSFALRGIKLDIDSTLPKSKQLEQALTQLRAKIAGQAEAKFLGGAPEVQRLTVAMGELRKEIGNIVIDSGVIETLKGLVNWMRSFSTETKAAVVEVGMLSVAILGLATVAPVLARIASGAAALVNALAGGQLVMLLGQVKSLADLRAFFTFPEPGRFAAMSGGLALVVTGIWAGVEAWRAWRASQEAALSQQTLEANTLAFAETLRGHITKMVESGRLTSEQAAQYLEYVNGAVAGFNAQIVTVAKLQSALSGVAKELITINGQAQTPAVEQVTPRETTDAELEARRKSAEKSRELERSLERLILDDKHALRTISDDEYFRERERLVLREYEQEVEAANKALWEIAAQRDKALNAPDVTADQRKKIDADYYVKRIELEAQLSAVESKRTTDRIGVYRESLERETDAKKEQLQLDQRRFEVGERLRAQSLQAVDSDLRLTEDEKLPRRIALMQQEVSAYDAEIGRLSALRDAQATTYEQRIAYQERIDGLSDKRQSTAGDLARMQDMPDPNAFGDQLTLRLVQLRQQWGSMARSMADVLTNTVTSAVQGLSNALANVIVGTQSAAVAFQQFAVQMLTSFIANVLQMIIMAKVAIPILTALGVLSGGSIPAAGSVATIASVGAAVAATSGYADGGVIRTGTGPRADDVLIRASRGEYVMPADKTAAYLPLLEAMRRGLVNMRDYADSIPHGLSSPYRSGYYAEGGAVSGGVANNVTVTPPPVNVAVLNSTQALRDFMEKHGAAMAFDYARKHKAQLGIRS